MLHTICVTVRPETHAPWVQARYESPGAALTAMLLAVWLERGGEMKESDVHAALQAELVELAELQAASAEARAPVELDQTTQGRLSRMDAMQAQAMALETQRRRELRCSRIEAALARLEEGEFGACVLCGEDIQEKRLVVDLTTPTCVDCAR